MTKLATPISPDEFMRTPQTRASVNGSSPWSQRYAAELKRVFLEHAANAPRTLQDHLGPSELGVECDRQVAGKLAALPSTNHIVDPWPSIVGTACHAWAADAFTADNIRHAMDRWKAERKVTPHPDHPGTADLWDALEQAVVDHKFLGPSSLNKIRKGWPRHYLVQLLLYCLGYWLEGFPVKRAVLAAYPRTEATLSGMFVRDIAFADANGYPSLAVLELLDTVFDDTRRRKVQAQQILAGQLRFEDVPATPDDDTCYFCPFYRSEAAEDGGPGCPGTKGGR